MFVGEYIWGYVKVLGVIFGLVYVVEISDFKCIGVIFSVEFC